LLLHTAGHGSETQSSQACNDYLKGRAWRTREASDMRLGRVFLVVAVLAVSQAFSPLASATPPGSPVAADPALPGPYAAKVAEYDGGATVVQDPQGLTYPSEIHGVLHYPATGAGPFPLIVFIHGNHGTCDVQGSPATGYPCPSTPVTGPTPSYRGYDYLGELLATQGYVTASIDGNAVAEPVRATTSSGAAT